jgi:hypothetical protein
MRGYQLVIKKGEESLKNNPQHVAKARQRMSSRYQASPAKAL